jgi:protocatechuate 3,4-dioxygenase alpha subunit
VSPGVTPSQTVGPFFAIGLTWRDGAFVAPPDTEGAFWIRGTVYDGAGEVVPDAIIETWQADGDGRFADSADPRGAISWAGFRGLGRSGTVDDGRYGIYTIKPGLLPTPDGRTEAPHLDVSVMARGLLARLVTRIYFEDEAAANATDAVLSALPPAADAATLIARRDGDGMRSTSDAKVTGRPFSSRSELGCGQRRAGPRALALRRSSSTAAAVCRRSGRKSRRRTAIDARLACADRFSAAITVPEASRSGTAIERRPASSSWSAPAYPRWRTVSSTLRNSCGSVTVRAVSGSSLIRRSRSSSSSSGSAARSTRPIDVQ